MIDGNQVQLLEVVRYLSRVGCPWFSYFHITIRSCLKYERPCVFLTVFALGKHVGNLRDHMSCKWLLNRHIVAYSVLFRHHRFSKHCDLGWSVSLKVFFSAQFQMGCGRKTKSGCGWCSVQFVLIYSFLARCHFVWYPATHPGGGNAVADEQPH